MPSKSPAQAKLMRAVAHGWKPDRMKGPSRKVAKEFVAADEKAEGYQLGGLKKKLKKVRRKVLKKAQRGDEKSQAFIRKYAGKYERGESIGDLARWAIEQRGQFDPRPGALAEAAAPPARTIQPVAGREFISGAAPPRRVGPPARTAADIAPGFQPGRVPPSLLAYLERARAAAGEPEEPVKAQYGGFMNRMRGRGRGLRGRGQPPGGGGLARAAVQPGGGVPLRGVGRPPGMGRPGAGGNVQAAVMPGRQFMPGGGGGAGMPGGASSLRGLMQQMRQQKMQQTGGGRPRVGPGDQQGAQARALQVQTGRPPMSRRQGFPGRGGRGRSGGRGRFRR